MANSHLAKLDVNGRDDTLTATLGNSLRLGVQTNPHRTPRAKQISRVIP